MRFLVHGRDDEGVDDLLHGLAEDHWSYMDAHAHRLVARGPTLSPDGERHTGSIHVVEARTVDEAHAFATEEPYARAGVYAEVTVSRWAGASAGTMWDKPAPSPGRPGTLVLVSWPDVPLADGEPVLDRVAALDRLIFGGLLVSDDGSRCTGLALAVDDGPAAAGAILDELGLPRTATPVLHRWQRGGRHQE